jgi:hypothetical protein
MPVYLKVAQLMLKALRLCEVPKKNKAEPGLSFKILQEGRPKGELCAKRGSRSVL